MFFVRWLPSSTADFAVIAMSHQNLWSEIDEASNDINEKLQLDPDGNGQHLSEGLWRIISGHLAAYYTIDGNEVNVSSVGWID